MFLSYTEGDLSLVVCTTAAAYDTELEEMIGFCGEAPRFITCDESRTLTNYFQDRSKFFIP